LRETSERRGAEVPVNGDAVAAMVVDVDVDGVSFVEANHRPGQAIVHGHHALGAAQPREHLLFHLKIYQRTTDYTRIYTQTIIPALKKLFPFVI